MSLISGNLLELPSPHKGMGLPALVRAHKVARTETCQIGGKDFAHHPTALHCKGMWRLPRVPRTLLDALVWVNAATNTWCGAHAGLGPIGTRSQLELERWASALLTLTKCNVMIKIALSDAPQHFSADPLLYGAANSKNVGEGKKTTTT